MAWLDATAARRRSRARTACADTRLALRSLRNRGEQRGRECGRFAPAAHVLHSRACKRARVRSAAEGTKVRLRWSAVNDGHGDRFCPQALHGRDAAARLEHSLYGSGRSSEPGGWTPRPRHKLPTAIRTYAVQHRGSARLTERAFKRTDPGVDRLRRQISIAALAVGTELEHGGLGVGGV